MIAWKKISEKLPPEGVPVETKIDDGKGCRNVQVMYRRGKLFVDPITGVYTYYTPTHWRYSEVQKIAEWIYR